MTKAQLREQEEARDKLREILKPGDTVFTILRHVSQSGMMRHVDALDAEHRHLSGLIARACDFRQTDRGAIKVGGCGMDAGFEIVHNLSYYLHPAGFECIGERCPSNEHSNGDRNYSPHQHTEGGYSLRHEWL